MTLGMMATDVEQRIDFPAMRAYKLARVHKQIEKQNLGALLLLDPDNIRYATSTYMSEWARDKYVRWAVIPRGGDPVCFEIGTVAEVKKILCPWIKPNNFRASTRWARGAYGLSATNVLCDRAVADIKAVLQENKVTDMPLGIDVVDMYLLEALHRSQLKVANGWPAMWEARLIKSPDELKVIELAASLADGLYEELTNFIRPGIKESDIVAQVYKWFFEHGADRVTGAVCVSGPRAWTHPHDHTDRMLRPGELVYIDVVGHYLGYATCYYRTFAVTRATQRMKDVYRRAFEWLQASIDAVGPRATTADIASKWPSAKELGFENETQAAGLQIGHGVGLSNHEKPFISRLVSLNQPEPLQPGMHFALETFASDGENGARIESQLIVTENGHKVITKWPAEELMICNPK